METDSRAWHVWGEPLAAGLNLLYTVGYLQTWPGSFAAAAAGSALFMAVCFQNKLKAESALWLFYVGFAIWGGFHASDVWPEPQQVPWSHHLISIGIGLLAWITITWALKRHTDADWPGWDAFTTAGSLLATYWMVRFVHANWVYWIVIDAAAVGLYWRKGLHWGAGLMAIYTLLAAEGYWDFLKWI